MVGVDDRTIEVDVDVPHGALLLHPNRTKKLYTVGDDPTLGSKAHNTPTTVKLTD